MCYLFILYEVIYSEQNKQYRSITHKKRAGIIFTIIASARGGLEELHPPTIRLFRQRYNAQRQPCQRRCAAGDRASCFPVILRGAFHAGIGVNQSSLVVIDRYARGVVRTACQQRCQQRHQNKFFHDIASE